MIWDINYQFTKRFPRTRGDRPIRRMLTALIAEVPPHARG